MVTRDRFIKAITDLRILVASQRIKRVLFNHSPLDDHDFIEVSIFSLEDKIDDDMWDIDVSWHEAIGKVMMTAALLTGDGLIKWYSPNENLGELLEKESLELLIKEWIVLNLDIFVSTNS